MEIQVPYVNHHLRRGGVNLTNWMDFDCDMMWLKLLNRRVYCTLILCLHTAHFLLRNTIHSMQLPEVKIFCTVLSWSCTPEAEIVYINQAESKFAQKKGQPRRQSQSSMLEVQTHHSILKNPFIHQFQCIPDNRSKVHMRQNVFINIYPRCNFNKFHALFGKGKYTAFGYIKNFLASFLGIVPTEGHMFHMFQELSTLTFPFDAKTTISNCHFQSASSKGANKDHFTSIPHVVSKVSQNVLCFSKIGSWGVNTVHILHLSKMFAL